MSESNFFFPACDLPIIIQDKEKVKKVSAAKKEEPSSTFQRRRVDMLLDQLTRQYPFKVKYFNIHNDKQNITPCVNKNIGFIVWPVLTSFSQPIKVQLKHPKFFSRLIRDRVYKIV